MSSIPSTDAFFLFYTVDVVPFFWLVGPWSSKFNRSENTWAKALNFRNSQYRGTLPTDYCTQCHSLFYGINCKRYHFDTKLCQTQKTCLRCQAQYTVIKDQRHGCGYAKCPVCHEWFFIQEHKCYIQPS